MNRQEELKRHFIKWRKTFCEDKNFVFDGIVREDKYTESPVKILFVLKEMPWDEKSDTYSLTKLMEEAVSGDQAYGNFCGKLALWSYGLLNCLPSWENVSKKWEVEKDQKEILDSLLRIAVMNTKKYPGEPRSEDEDLKHVLERDKDLLLQEIRIIEPEVVVCCGVWHLWKEILEVEDSETVTSPNGFQWFEYSIKENVSSKFLCFPHPSRPLENAIMYSFYIDGIRGDNKLNSIFMKKCQPKCSGG